MIKGGKFYSDDEISIEEITGPSFHVKMVPRPNRREQAGSEKRPPFRAKESSKHSDNSPSFRGVGYGNSGGGNNNSLLYFSPKANKIEIGEEIDSPSQLKWYIIRSRDGGPNKVKLCPCRVLSSDEARQYLRKQRGGREGLGRHQSVIQCFSFPNISAWNYLVVQEHLLIPFEQKINGVEVLNEEIIDRYLRQLKTEGKSNHHSEAERTFLKRVYDHAVKSETDYNAQKLKELREYHDDNSSGPYMKNEKQLIGLGVLEQSNSEKDFDESDIDMEELEVPYTQAITFDPDDFPKITETCNEPLRVGDEVEYYCPMFVAGDKRGLRQAFVLSIDPKDDIPLVLSNGECLPTDIKVKRVKVMSDGQLIEHPGVFRPIRKFRLIKSNGKTNSNAAAGVMKEAARFGDIMHRNVTKMRTVAEAEGFAPMDLLVNIKGSKVRPPPSPGKANLPIKQPSVTTKKIDLSSSSTSWSESSIDDITGLSDRKRNIVTLTTNIISITGTSDSNPRPNKSKSSLKSHKRTSFSSTDSSINLVQTRNLANKSLPITDYDEVGRRNNTLVLSGKYNTSVSSDDDSAKSNSFPEVNRCARSPSKTQRNNLNPAKRAPKNVCSLRRISSHNNKKTQHNQDGSKSSNQHKGKNTNRFEVGENRKPRSEDHRGGMASESSTSTLCNFDQHGQSERKLSISSDSQSSISSHNLLASPFRRKKPKIERSIGPNSSLSSTISTVLFHTFVSDNGNNKKEKGKPHTRRQELSDVPSSDEDRVKRINFSTVKGNRLDSFNISESKHDEAQEVASMRAQNRTKNPTSKISQQLKRRRDGKESKTARMRSTGNKVPVLSTVKLNKGRRELVDISSSDGENKHSSQGKRKSADSFSRNESNSGSVNDFKSESVARGKTPSSSKNFQDSMGRKDRESASGGWMQNRGGWERSKNDLSMFSLTISRKK
ncbi:hypothetical protein ACHAXS_012922 [Conticribra weissflogii]